MSSARPILAVTTDHQIESLIRSNIWKRIPSRILPGSSFSSKDWAAAEQNNRPSDGQVPSKKIKHCNGMVLEAMIMVYCNRIITIIWCDIRSSLRSIVQIDLIFLSISLLISIFLTNWVNFEYAIRLMIR